MTQRTEGATVRFDATLSAVGTSTVLRLPETASKNLPSRGQVADPDLSKNGRLLEPGDDRS